MLLAFSGTNVRSFRDEFTLSLLATRVTEPRVAREVPWRQGGEPIGVLPSAVLFGANASGKSNVLRAMADLRSLVLHSFRKGDPTGGLPRWPFRPAIDQPTSYEVDLVLDGVRHVYSVTIDDERVLEERAVRYPHGKEALLFRRQGDELEFGPPLRTQGRWISKLLRPNAAFLSTAAATNEETLLPLFAWFTRNLRLAEAANRHLRLAQTAEMIADAAGNDRLLRLLRAADFGIVGAKRRDMDPEMRDRLRRAVHILAGREGEPDGSEAASIAIDDYGFVLEHSSNGSTFELDQDEESLGTMVWLGLIGPVIDALEQGSVLLADELDASLHPVLVERLVRLFQDPATNPRRAQLIANAHDVHLVEGTGSDRIIGRDQVWFTEKKADGSTSLYPLLDFSPRRDESVGRRYLGGMYGATPIVSEAEFATVFEDLAGAGV